MTSSNSSAIGSDQTGDSGIGLEDAYGLETPDDSRNLYRQWATSYDSDFIDRYRYIYHVEVANALADHVAVDTVEPVLDVGCGTGVAGDALRQLGVGSIDGLDISPEMLAEARQRRDASGRQIYDRLMEADLTGRLDIDPDRYGAVVSTGTFTHGHVGPRALAELIRVVRPGGVLCLGVNEQFYRAANFEAAVNHHHREGDVRRWYLKPVRVYENPPEGHESDTGLALILFRSE